MEAKKPSEALDVHAKQALEYGYQNSVPWVVLTNFEEIRVYNSQYFDKAEEVRRLFKPILLSEIPDRFEDLWLFSKPAFLERQIDKVAEKYGKVKPKEPITNLLAKDLGNWRTLLTKSISERKKENNLPEKQEDAELFIDECVQRILDRLLFLRVAEDRGFEEAILGQTLRKWEDEGKKRLFEYLSEAFRRADDTYNSGLFQPHESEKLEIADSALEKVIRESYNSPNGLKYNFSAINADILGSVYEQYLSILLKKTAKGVKLKENQAHRKEQGIYYTPTYIVDYIVRNTLGETLKGRSVQEADEIKVLDMACGSGSFLLKAFDVLEEYHSEKDASGEKQARLDFSEADAKTTAKRRILENNIYGVDLDEKAVEIAQLNLLLRMAEKKGKLPILRNNVQHGNSLIDDKEVSKEAFEWEARFPRIIRFDSERKLADGAGFDVIIGNPPYGVEFSETDSSFLKSTYSTCYGKVNSYRLFVENAIRLLKRDGFLGYIIPNTWLSDNDSSKLRRLLLETVRIDKIVILPESLDVFEGVTQATTILIIKKQSGKESNISFFYEKEKRSAGKHFLGKISQKAFAKTQDNKIISNPLILKILEKIEHVGTSRLDNFFRINQGEVNLTVFKKALGTEPGNGINLLLRGTDIFRYGYTKNFSKEGYVEVAKIRRNDSDKERIVVQEVSNMQQTRRLKGCLIGTRINCAHTCNYLYLKKKDEPQEFFLALINSKLLDFYFKSYSSTNHISGVELRALPIKIASPEVQSTIIKLVSKILALNKKLPGLKQTNERQKIEDEITRVDAEIDCLVYSLYGLTDEEIRLVEESFSK